MGVHDNHERESDKLDDLGAFPFYSPLTSCLTVNSEAWALRLLHKSEAALKTGHAPLDPFGREVNAIEIF